MWLMSENWGEKWKAPNFRVYPCHWRQPHFRPFVAHLDVFRNIQSVWSYPIPWISIRIFLHNSRVLPLSLFHSPFSELRVLRASRLNLHPVSGDWCKDGAGTFLPGNHCALGYVWRWFGQGQWRVIWPTFGLVVSEAFFSDSFRLENTDISW